jgi:hypothetical protein
MDLRENILSRLVELAAAVPGINSGLRNKTNPSDQEIPAIVIFDADETADEDDPGKESRPADAPRRVVLDPGIEIMAGAASQDIGTVLNGFKAAFWKSIVTDATLLGYVKDRRGIRYNGCSTDLALGRSMEGNMSLHIAFTYALRASDL